jgi:hypothetical protein
MSRKIARWNWASFLGMRYPTVLDERHLTFSDQDRPRDLNLFWFHNLHSVLLLGFWPNRTDIVVNVVQNALWCAYLVQCSMFFQHVSWNSSFFHPSHLNIFTITHAGLCSSMTEESWSEVNTWVTDLSWLAEWHWQSAVRVCVCQLCLDTDVVKNTTGRQVDIGEAETGSLCHE